MLLPVSAMGEILTIKQTVKQTFGGSQSADDARISAVAKAKREALEKAGVYIEALTVVKEAKVEKDEILALTAGAVKAEVVSQKNYHTEDAFGMEIIVNVVVDTSVLEKRVKKQLQDRTHLTQLKDTQKREKELLLRVAQLEEENRKLSLNKQSTQNLKKEFKQASQGLTAVDWFNQSMELWDGKKYTNPKKAIEYLDKAIRLKPDLAAAYEARGLYYFSQGQYQQAIEDYNEAIRLEVDDAFLSFAYSLRGFAYSGLLQHQRGIKDFDEAIRLKPNDDNFYGARGFAYAYLGQYQHAINDYAKAIRLKPDNAKAYYDRGFTYHKLGQYQQAIEDYDQSIRLKPDNAVLAVAYGNRGNSYDKLGKHQLALEDYNHVIQLEPDNATAYFNRGRAHFTLGQYQRAIGDCNDAIQFKPDYANAYVIRGLANAEIAQYQRAIDDYNDAIRLQSNDAKTYVNRGDAYVKLGKQKQAIDDFNKAILLKSDFAVAYESRGLYYLKQSNTKLGCPDAQKACDLGNCELFKFAKSKGYCSIESARDERFIGYDGIVLDKETGLMWAAKDNSRDINWQGARSYCENYRGGGYTDWRMPTWKELSDLYDASKTYRADCGYNAHLTELIHLTCAPWASERNGSEAVVFFFMDGSREWLPTSSFLGSRALPVRSVK